MSDNPTPTLAKDIAVLIAQYTDFLECDEWHIHNDTEDTGHEGATPLPHDFDEDKLQAALLKRFEAVMLEVIGEDLGEGDDETFAYYENRLRAEQRQRLTAVLSGEETA